MANIKSCRINAKNNNHHHYHQEERISLSEKAVWIKNANITIADKTQELYRQNLKKTEK